MLERSSSVGQQCSLHGASARCAMSLNLSPPDRERVYRGRAPFVLEQRLRCSPGTKR